MTAAATVPPPEPTKAEPRRLRAVRPGFGMIALGPLLAFMLVFLIAPAVRVTIQAFFVDGAFTLEYLEQIFKSRYLEAFKDSILVSASASVIAGVLGLLIAYAAVGPRAPRFVRGPVTTFSAVASYFGGVPLAFAFVATLGSQGLITRWLAGLGLDIYEAGFTLLGLTGLIIIYTYFATALMVVILAPTLDGLRQEWREAAANLGARPAVYWRRVGVPVLMPAFIGAIVLAFGTCFAAYSTPYALTSGHINLVAVLVGVLRTGEVLADPHLSAALSFGTMAILFLTMVAYTLMQRRAARWLR